MPEGVYQITDKGGRLLDLFWGFIDGMRRFVHDYDEDFLDKSHNWGTSDYNAASVLDALYEHTGDTAGISEEELLANVGDASITEGLTAYMIENGYIEEKRYEPMIEIEE